MNAVDPNLLPQVNPTGGQVGLMRLLMQQQQSFNNLPFMSQRSPQSMGEGMAGFAQNFLAARNAMQTKRLLEQQLQEQRDQQIAEGQRIQSLRDHLVKTKGMSAEEATFYATNATQLGTYFNEMHKAELDAAKEAKKIQLEQSVKQKEWQSSFDAAFSQLKGFELKSALDKMSSVPPEALSPDQLALKGKLQHELDRATALSQAAANNPAVLSFISERTLKGEMPLPSEMVALTGAQLENIAKTEGIVGARLDNQGKVIGNDAAAFNLGLNKTFAPEERTLGILGAENTVNRGYQGLAQDQVQTAQALKIQQIQLDPTKTPEQKAAEIAVLNGGADLFRKDINPNVVRALEDQARTAASISIDPATGGYVKTNPPFNIFGINTSEPIRVPMAGNPNTLLQDAGIAPPAMYRSGIRGPEPSRVQLPVVPQPPATNVSAGDIYGGKRSVPLSPQDQGLQSRNQLMQGIAGIGQSVAGLGDAAVQAQTNLGGNIQGFFGLPFNPMDLFGTNQKYLNGRR